MTGDEGEGGLFQFLVSSESFQVGESPDGNSSVHLRLTHLYDPGVLESFLSGRSLVGVVSQELRNEVLRLGGDVLPAGFGEGVLSNSDLLHDLLIAVAIERGHTRKNDVEDNSA